MVCLKSPHNRTLPFFFITGTTGVAHSLQSYLVKMPSFCNLVNSTSTFGRRAYGTCLALQNFGWLFSFRFSFALVDFSRPLSSSKTSLYLSSCHRVDGFPGGVVANVLIAFQSSVIFPSQSRPKRAGPQGRRKHSTTYKFSFCSQEVLSWLSPSTKVNLSWPFPWQPQVLAFSRT